MKSRAVRWTIGVVGGALVAVAIVAGVTSRSSTLRALVIKTLSDRLDSEVEMADFSVDTFPSVHVYGAGLVIRHKGRRDVPPMVSIKSFTVDGGLFGLLARPRRFRTVTLIGLELNIPPGGFKRAAGDTAAAAGSIELKGMHQDDDSGGPAAIVVDSVVAEDASIVLIPRRSDKKPKVFAVHRLTLEPLGKAKVMSFVADITNPLPKGLVQTRGTFGPWGRDDPGSSPLTGTYTFNHADLSTIKGIGGMLDSTGTFSGQLDRISVSGETRTPDFRVNTGAHPIPLETKFEAVVDGTDGDTYLNAVSAKLQNTPLTAKGAIVGEHGVKGRTVQVHVKIDDGRIEDVLLLTVKTDQPILTGRLALEADLNLPAGPETVMERLELSGDVDVRGARFTGEAQSKISDMSERARGLNPVETTQDVASKFHTRFRLDRGLLTLRDSTFTIPGATILIAGSYGLKSEVLDFEGTVRMKATVSQAAGGGIKSTLLKVVDPLFRKDGAGAVLPINIRGSRQQPKFGLDVKRVFKKK
ncbi:MAG: AsmA-like C-terminal region-containing protein [Acidobacteriota bacterium]